MIILGIDTSCEQASCALNIDGLITEEQSVADKRKHSETLMPMVEEFLKKSGVSLNDVDLFAVSAGPGSFTGLRIGMAAVKGMAFTLDKKIAVIKTPDVLANYFSAGDGIVCPIIDARNNQVYTAVYKCDEEIYKPITDYMGIKIEDLADLLGGYDSVKFCGDASLKHYEFFRAQELNCDQPNSDMLYPSAGVLVKLAALGEGDTLDPSEAVPYYLRVSQAERFHGKS